jgi:hypothetical protein
MSPITLRPASPARPLCCPFLPLPQSQGSSPRCRTCSATRAPSGSPAEAPSRQDSAPASRQPPLPSPQDCAESTSGLSAPAQAAPLHERCPPALSASASCPIYACNRLGMPDCPAKISACTPQKPVYKTLGASEGEENEPRHRRRRPRGTGKSCRWAQRPPSTSLRHPAAGSQTRARKRPFPATRTT